MNRLCNLLTGASLGAGVMYFLDPVVGNRRRSLIRDQLTHALNKGANAADATWRDMRNRSYGLMAELRSCVTQSGRDVDDSLLVQRVRSNLGRHVSHPSTIEVTARDGHVRVSGPILEHEVDGLLSAVELVRGVRDVENRLEVHTSAENISALQGGRPRPGEPSEWMQENWSPTARLLAGAAGTVLMLNCLTRRTPGAILLGTAGFGLTMRAATNQEMTRVLGLGSGRRGFDVQKTIIINQPVEDVFSFLSDPENYPKVTDIIASARELGDGRIQKTLRGPAGAELTIEEKIMRLVPNEFIACRSEPGSSVQYAARAWFEPVGPSRTRVRIQATYNLPGGALAHSAAWLAGLDLKSQLDDMLMRAKTYLETGTPPHHAAERIVAGRHEQKASIGQR